MKRLARLVVLVLAVAAFATGFFLIAANRDPILLDLLFWRDVPVRAGLAIVLAFSVGMLAGTLLGLGTAGSREFLRRGARHGR